MSCHQVGTQSQITLQIDPTQCARDVSTRPINWCPSLQISVHDLWSTSITSNDSFSPTNQNANQKDTQISSFCPSFALARSIKAPKLKSHPLFHKQTNKQAWCLCRHPYRSHLAEERWFLASFLWVVCVRSQSVDTTGMPFSASISVVFSLVNKTVRNII